MNRFSHLRIKNVPFIIIAVLLLLALPLIVIQNKQTQTVQSNAAHSSNPLVNTNLKFPYKSDVYYAIANQWQNNRPADAALMRQVGDQQKAIWYGVEWAPTNTIASSVDSIMQQAASLSAVPVFVTYSIPNRDCSGYSGGGSASIANYKAWIDQYAVGLKNRRAIVIIEPDALTMFDCLSSVQQTDRITMIHYAVTKFKSQGANVYIDAGNARWIAAATMAQRLNQAGIEDADGFAVNVSNFYTTEESTTYGNQISAQTNSKHFVIDTSRNGLGPYIYPATNANQWCNPPGRALGTPATANTGQENVDAYLWIKTVGESDGVCTEFGQNDPAAGTMMPEYALGLAQRATWLNVTPTSPVTLTPTNIPTPTMFVTPTPTPTPTPTLIPTVAPTSTPSPSVNALKNNSFETGITPWQLQVLSPVTGSVSQVSDNKIQGNYSARILINKTSSDIWKAQFKQDGLSLVAGKTYTISFWAKASKARNIQYTLQLSVSPYTVYSEKTFALSTNWKQYSYSFKANQSVTAKVFYGFNLAQATGTVWLDNTSFLVQ